MSLRARLLLLLMALWLPAVLGFALLAWYVHEQEVETLERQVAEFAEAMNTDVEQELDKRVVMARTLASTRAAREGDLARLREESLVATEGHGQLGAGDRRCRAPDELDPPLPHGAGPAGAP